MNTPSKKSPRTFRLKWRWIILALIVLLYLPQLPGCMMANTSKTGRILDVTTGNGIPDVTVVAAEKIFDGSSFSGGEEVYRVMTHTDADGSYHVPGTWLQSLSTWPFRFLPWFHPRDRWLISAFKPGYAFVGDDDAWLRYDDYGHPKHLPLSTVVTPPATWLGFVVRVDPLQLKPVQLSTKQSAIYYRAIFAVGHAGGSYVGNQTDDAVMKKPVYDFLLPQVCNEEQNAQMDLFETDALGAFVQNNDAFMRKLRELEPNGFDKIEMLPVFRSSYDRYTFRSGHVCTAMMAGGELQ